MSEPVTDAPSGDAAPIPAFGRWLAQERELRGLSQDEVATRTKLGHAAVEALESGDATRMPPSAYVVGYLRSYATAIGLDPDEVVLRWQEAAAVPASGPAPHAKVRRGPVVVAAAVAVVVAAAAAVALLGGP